MVYFAVPVGFVKTKCITAERFLKFTVKHQVFRNANLYKSSFPLTKFYQPFEVQGRVRVSKVKMFCAYLLIATQQQHNFDAV